MTIFETLAPELNLINQQLLSCVPQDFPENLSTPIHDFLQTPGKKVRPLLALYAATAVGGSITDALPAATAVELFHDFTLIHDDIMDHDEMRRGIPTLHVKYDDSTAILAGDALLGLAYKQLLQSPEQHRARATAVFTEALIKVCEGQALDKAFETRQNISLAAYLDMIAKKTAWLLQASCELGAICGGGSEAEITALRDFGYNIGMGFQIQDDLLDFVADEKQLGKKVGSDFRMQKTTYVTLKYREKLLKTPELANKYPIDLAEFANVDEFLSALEDLKLIYEGEAESDKYIANALLSLENVTPASEKNPLYDITAFLKVRRY